MMRTDRKLWSLWDMLTLYMGAFFDVSERITSLSAWIAADSDKPTSVFSEQRALEAVDRSYARSAVNKLDDQLLVLGARVTAMAVRRAIECIDQPNTTWREVKERIDDIRARLSDELTLSKCFSLEADKHRYFEPAEPLFGSQFLSKFPSATFELDEAAKCLALSRSTASVFHMMRIMEIGIRAVARCLQIPDPLKPAERNWGNILKKIWDDGVLKKWPTTKDRSSEDGALFEALHASLDAVKNPWRNATMHVESIYTDEEAEHIFFAVKGFMKKLASRCDESGLPHA